MIKLKIYFKDKTEKTIEISEKFDMLDVIDYLCRNHHGWIDWKIIKYK